MLMAKALQKGRFFAIGNDPLVTVERVREG
jgi:hypothetical protein